MIPFDFEYYRPDSIEEAVEVFERLDNEAKQPLYLGGGSEVITLGRLNRLQTRAVIDLKQIPECKILQLGAETLVLGAGLSLAEVAEANYFPLLTESAGRVADHTSRCTITLGSNICSHLMYREAVLAFLVADSHAVIAGRQGTRRVALNEVFNQQLQLQRGEFLVQIVTDAGLLTSPHRGVKKTKDSRINYPLVSCAFLEWDGRLRMAVTGLCSFPFRSKMIEAYLNDESLEPEERIAQSIRYLPAPIVADVEGSAQYRQFVYSNALAAAIAQFEGRD